MKKGQRVKSLTGKTKGMVGVASQCIGATGSVVRVAVTFSYGIGKRTYWFNPENLRVLKDGKANSPYAGGTAT